MGVIKMTQGFERNIVFMLIKDECLACAMGLDRPGEEEPSDVIDSLERKSSLEANNRLGVVSTPPVNVFKCPLGLVCYPPCYWWQDDECIFPECDS
jgi:hypothetical protein